MIDAVDGGITNKYNSRATLAYSVLFFGLRACASPAQPSHRSERDPPGIKAGWARKRKDNE